LEAGAGVGSAVLQHSIVMIMAVARRPARMANLVLMQECIVAILSMLKIK
jgi:hypothetical protein